MTIEAAQSQHFYIVTIEDFNTRSLVGWICDQRQRHADDDDDVIMYVSHNNRGYGALKRSNEIFNGFECTCCASSNNQPSIDC